jgi:hypothetical protein
MPPENSTSMRFKKTRRSLFLYACFIENTYCRTKNGSVIWWLWLSSAPLVVFRDAVPRICCGGFDFEDLTPVSNKHGLDRSNFVHLYDLNCRSDVSPVSTRDRDEALHLVQGYGSGVPTDILNSNSIINTKGLNVTSLCRSVSSAECKGGYVTRGVKIFRKAISCEATCASRPGHVTHMM